MSADEEDKGQEPEKVEHKDRAAPSKSDRLRVAITVSRMSPDMEEDAIACAKIAVIKYQSKSDIAAYVREQFDKRYMPRWHCIVADDFGYSVVPDPMNYICFELGAYGVLLFKSG